MSEKKPGWYYAVEGERKGPVTSAELKRLADSGKLKASDLVWKEGMSEWAPAKKLKGLFPDTPNAPPPALPTTPKLLDTPALTARLKNQFTGFGNTGIKLLKANIDRINKRRREISEVKSTQHDNVIENEAVLDAATARGCSSCCMSSLLLIGAICVLMGIAGYSTLTATGTGTIITRGWLRAAIEKKPEFEFIPDYREMPATVLERIGTIVWGVCFLGAGIWWYRRLKQTAPKDENITKSNPDDGKD